MTREILDRAFTYPYAAHPTDYLFQDGSAKQLPDTHRFDGLTPVIAVGSNRAPEQLRRKFHDMDVRIPVTRIGVQDADVVYAASLAGYGSVPATLAPSPGTRVTLWITWLDGPSLSRMDDTESLGEAYDRVPVKLPVTDAGLAPVPESLHLYVARRGLLTVDGQPVALSEVPATNRLYRERGQVEMHQTLHAQHAGPDETLESWVLSLIGTDGAARRHSLITAMGKTSQPAPAF